MSEQEYLTNKDQLDNPQVIVCVNRKGGPRESKPPKWFTSYMDNFEKNLWIKIDQKLDDKFKAFAKLNNLKTE